MTGPSSDRIVTALGVLFVLSLAATLLQHPDLASGRTIELNTHGRIVYMSMVEQLRLWAGFTLSAVLVVGVFAIAKLKRMW